MDAVIEQGVSDTAWRPDIEDFRRVSAKLTSVMRARNMSLEWTAEDRQKTLTPAETYPRLAALVLSLEKAQHERSAASAAKSSSWKFRDSCLKRAPPRAPRGEQKELAQEPWSAQRHSCRIF